jgi:hypothetical protein
VIGGAPAAAAAALLYLVTEELLMEAHTGTEPEAPWSTLVLFSGFLAWYSAPRRFRERSVLPMIQRVGSRSTS